MIFNINKLRFKTRIIIGFSFILFISTISSIIAIYQLHQISIQSDLIYKHPYKVSNSVKDINIYINSIHVNLKDINNSKDIKDIEKYKERISNYERLFYNSIIIISSQYLGSQTSVENVYDSFKKCIDIANSAYKLKKIDLNLNIDYIISNEFKTAKNILLNNNKILTDFAENKAKSFYASIKNKRKKSIRHLTFVIFNLFLFSILIAIQLSNNISKPIIKFINKARSIIEKETYTNLDIKLLNEDKLLKFIGNELDRVYKENKSILEATMENSHAGIAITDAQTGNIKYINKVGKIMGGNGSLGIKDAIEKYNNILRWNILNLDETPYRYNDLPHIKAIRKGKNISDEFIIKVNDKKKRYFWANAAPIHNDKKEITAGIVIFLDITKQKQAIIDLQKQNKKYALLNRKYKKQNHELIKAKKKAEEINRLKSSFMATMSHELRTPLNTVIGLSDLIDSEMDNAEILEMVKLINKNGNQLLDIIESILSLTLLQSGEYKINEEIFSVNGLCSELKFHFNSELLARKKQHLKTLFCEKNMCYEIKINTDKAKLKELLMHMFVNAIKFTDNGEIECSYSVKNKDIIFSIRDTGHGIDNELMDVIFEKFRQVDNSNTRKFGGIGLGLATCKEIAKLLNGKIDVKSTKGVGTTFYFTLKNVVIKNI